MVAFARAVHRHFYESDTDEEIAPYLEAFASGYRAWWVRDGERVRANLGVIETDLSLPGGARLPVAAVTAVGVAQTDRRRGLLRTLMAACLEEAHERGEPAAALFASEAPIYGRFGFGVTAPSSAYRIERGQVAFRDPVDVRQVVATTPERAAADWPAIHERLRGQRGGMVGVTPQLWKLSVVVDPPSWRDGATARQLVEVPGRGIALYRVRGGEDDAGRADGSVLLLQLLATDPEAEAALWQHVTDLDLTVRTLAWLRPPDDALPELVTDRHALGMRDGSPLYLRVLDLPALLSARTVAAAGEVVLEVVDPDGPAAGRYELEGAPPALDCRPTTREPDLVVPVEALAGPVLGGVRATTLAAARRIEQRRPGAAAELDRLLAVDRAPWASVTF